MGFFGIVKMEHQDACDRIVELILACGAMMSLDKPFSEMENGFIEEFYDEGTRKGSSIFPKLNANKKSFSELNRNAAIKIKQLIKEEKWPEARFEFSQTLLLRVKLSIYSYVSFSVTEVAFNEAKELVFETIPKITDDFENLYIDKDKQALLREIQYKIIPKWKAMGLVYEN